MGLAVDKKIRNITYKMNFAGFTIDREEEVGSAWPTGTIQYFMPAGLDGGYQTLVKKAMQRWELCIFRAFGFAAIKFVGVATAATGVVTIKDNSNSADLGYLTSDDLQCGVNWKGDQKHAASLPHEIGHTIGLAHEHMRTDAPDEVQRTLDSLQVQTRVQTLARFQTHGSDFDGNSIMMYSEQAKALNVKSNTKAGGCMITCEQVQAGAWSPSSGDLAMISYLYDGKRTSLA